MRFEASQDTYDNFLKEQVREFKERPALPFSPFSPSVAELQKYLSMSLANIMFGGVAPMGMGNYGKAGPKQNMVKKLEQTATSAAKKKITPKFKLKPEPGGFYSQLERSIKTDPKILGAAQKAGGKLPAAKLLSLLKKSGVTERELKITGVGKDLKELGMESIDPKLFENRGMTMHAVKTPRMHEHSIYKPFMGNIESSYITSPDLPDWRKRNLDSVSVKSLETKLDALYRNEQKTGIPPNPDVEDSLYARLHAIQDTKYIKAHPYGNFPEFTDPESPDKLAWYYSAVRPIRENNMVFSSEDELEKPIHLPNATVQETKAIRAMQLARSRGKQIGTAFNLVEVQSDIRSWMSNTGSSPWDNDEARTLALSSYLDEAVKKAEAGEITHITIPTPEMITNRWPGMDPEVAEKIYKDALKYVEKRTGKKASTVQVDTELKSDQRDNAPWWEEPFSDVFGGGKGGRFKTETWGIELTPDVIESIKAKPQKIGLNDFYRQVTFG